MGVFLSYSHKDARQAEKIAAVLRSSGGQDVWFDHALRGGDKYYSIIAQQILQHDIFVFLVSADSCASEWCETELQLAKSNRKRIIAIWLEPVDLPPGILVVLQNTHYIHHYNLSEEDFVSEVAYTFSQEEADAFRKQRGDISESEQEVREIGKYFLTAKQQRRVAYLLRQEQKGAYSECFKPENAVLLGLGYELGVQTEVDLLKAEFYYKVGAHKGSQDARYLLAALMIERDAEHTQHYIGEMSAAAEAGGIIAMTCWGDVYYKGEYGLAKDPAAASALWRKAADAGDPLAQYYLAYGYKWGEGVDKDPGIALMYALTAAEQEFPRAFRLIGRMYRDGSFVPKDLEKAMGYYQKAIDSGDSLSLCYMGDMLYSEKLYTESLAWYRRAVEAADNGKTKSSSPYHNLGFSLYMGKGCEPDLPAAIELYLKGAQRGHSSCLKYVVSMIDELESPQQKLPLLMEAAQYNCKFAYLYLGLLFDDAEKVQEALDWWHKGAEMGDGESIVQLAYVYSQIPSKDSHKAFRDHQKAMAAFGQLFSRPDEEIWANWKNPQSMSARYHYGYVVELCDDSPIDTALLLEHMRRSVESDAEYLAYIPVVLVAMFLHPEQWGRTEKNVPLALKLMELAEEFMPDFHTEDEKKNRQVMQGMAEHYEELAQCCRRGEQIPKNRENYEHYLRRARHYRKCSGETKLDNDFF